jgi:imidazolonepropionase
MELRMLPSDCAEFSLVTRAWDLLDTSMPDIPKRCARQNGTASPFRCDPTEAEIGRRLGESSRRRPGAGGPMTDVDFVLGNCGELVTPVGRAARRGRTLGELVRVERAAVAARDGVIVAAGPEREVRRAVRLLPGGIERDARGASVLPGFVDPHTHAVFGAPRAAEYAARLAGRTYAEIAAAGGGIHSSVRDVRARSAAELVELAVPRLRRMLAHGTTTVEIKTGYGLTPADETKLLGVVQQLAARGPQTLVPTFLGAHEIPLEYRGGRRAAYVQCVVEEMLPAAARLAEFNDVFCEPTVFTLEESAAILRAGRAHGLRPKLHADELEPYGGAELACQLGAVSADHLIHVSDAGIAALAAAETVAVLLPATSFGLALSTYAPARRLVEAGAAVALATDFNPGSSYCESMQAVWSLACSLLRLTPAEALAACTLNAAAAVGRADRLGSLEVGKRCDLVVLHTNDWREVPYHFGVNNVREVVVGGRVAWTDPSDTGATPEAA